jgi:hypothetical protein
MTLSLSSSWEFPELVLGLKPMVTDSDGKNFPWYGSHTEVVSLQGPKPDHSTHKVSMSDNFMPHVSLEVPIAGQNKRKTHLTNVKRKQRFVTWLAAMDIRRGVLVVLRTFKWKMNVEIEIDPTKEQGSRARLVSNPLPAQPRVLLKNIRIPSCALYPANANSSQVLTWQSSASMKPELVLKSKRISSDVFRSNKTIDTRNN